MRTQQSAGGRDSPVSGTETRSSECLPALCSSSFLGAHLPVSLEGKAGLLHFPCIKFTAHSLCLSWKGSLQASLKENEVQRRAVVCWKQCQSSTSVQACGPRTRYTRPVWEGCAHRMCSTRQGWSVHPQLRIKHSGG